MKISVIIAALGCSVLVAAAGAAEAPQVARNCIACHGDGGVSDNPQWPTLAGQNAGYLEGQIKAFRDGERENPAMMPFVAKLSDADIADLAAYYSRQEAVASGNGDPEQVEAGRQLAGYCSACHGYAGRPATDEWPVLAGQHAPYLKAQLTSFKRGERVQPLMQAALKDLGEKEFAALAAYYSQMEP